MGADGEIRLWDLRSPRERVPRLFSIPRSPGLWYNSECLLGKGGQALAAQRIENEESKTKEKGGGGPHDIFGLSFTQNFLKT